MFKGGLSSLFGKGSNKKPEQQDTAFQLTQRRLGNHTGLKIAISGTFGKTTFREMLQAVLSASDKDVAASSDNESTITGISQFAGELSGREDVIIFEFEGYSSGDIKQLSEMVRPDIGIITGINEAHLSRYGSIDMATAAVLEINESMEGKPVYKNGDSRLLTEKITAGDPLVFNGQGCNGWQVTEINVTLQGTSFVATKQDRTIRAESKLLGAHTVGPLAACIAIAESLGMSDQQIESGIAATQPSEHRMSVRNLAGATIIDDTKGGNIDSVRAGIDLLKKIPAVRKIYITPGLAEQGDRTAEVHEDIGKMLASTASIVVLIKNSNTHHIVGGLNASGFRGHLNIVSDPVTFFAGLEQFVLSDDVVLIQNDWTDNFS